MYVHCICTLQFYNELCAFHSVYPSNCHCQSQRRSHWIPCPLTLTFTLTTLTPHPSPLHWSPKTLPRHRYSLSLSYYSIRRFVAATAPLPHMPVLCIYMYYGISFYLNADLLQSQQCGIKDFDNQKTCTRY